jgi:hypothetical protein
VLLGWRAIQTARARPANYAVRTRANPHHPTLPTCKNHARGEGARLCSGPAWAHTPPSDSSAEDQARRAGSDASVARNCANLPPKLMNLVCARSLTCAHDPDGSRLEKSRNRVPLPCAHAARGTRHRNVQLESTSASVVAEKRVSTRSELAVGANRWARHTLPCTPRRNISFA